MQVARISRVTVFISTACLCGTAVLAPPVPSRAGSYGTYPVDYPVEPVASTPTPTHSPVALHYYAAREGTLSPVSSSSSLRSFLQQQNLEEAAAARPRVKGADASLWYQGWEVADDFDGSSYGANLSYVTGERHGFQVSVPIYRMDPDSGDEDATSLGIDCTYRFRASDLVTVGAHVGYVYDFWSGDWDDHDSWTMGPFVTAGLRLGERWSLAGILGYDYITSSQGPFDEDYGQIVPGAMLSARLTDSFALGVFGSYYFLSGLDDGADDSYWEGGLQASWSSGSWSLRCNASQVFDLDDYDAYRFYLGSVWNF